MKVERFRESNLRSVLGAACVVTGNCSDDGFLCFCGWLIGQGEAKF